MRLLLAIGVAALAWVAAYTFSKRVLSPRLRPATLATTKALILAALNAFNLCAPGWCGWCGFPLRYYTWSDSMGTFNGFRFGYPTFHPIAAAVDVSVAIAICIVVFRHARRSVSAGPVV